MTLSELKTFMSERRRASVMDISIHFGTSAAAVHLMLDQWMAKGRVRRLDAQGCCPKSGGGCACKEKPPEVFEWLM